MNKKKCSCGKSDFRCFNCQKRKFYSGRCGDCGAMVKIPEKHASNCPRSMKLKRRKEKRKKIKASTGNNEMIEKKDFEIKENDVVCYWSRLPRKFIDLYDPTKEIIFPFEGTTLDWYGTLWEAIKHISRESNNNRDVIISRHILHVLEVLLMELERKSLNNKVRYYLNSPQKEEFGLILQHTFDDDTFVGKEKRVWRIYSSEEIPSNLIVVGNIMLGVLVSKKFLQIEGQGIMK